MPNYTNANLQVAKEILLNVATNLESKSGEAQQFAAHVRSLVDWLDSPDKLATFLASYITLFLRMPAVQVAAALTIKAAKMMHDKENEETFVGPMGHA